MFEIRQIKPEDIFSVIAIANETLPEQYSPAVFNYYYELFPQGFLVVEQHHKIIGYAVAIHITKSAGKILMFAITQSHRRKKIGSALLITLLKELKTSGITEIELEVRTENGTAIEFYKRHGFHITDTLQSFYQNGEDAHLMKKRN